MRGAGPMCEGYWFRAQALAYRVGRGRAALGDALEDKHIAIN